MSLRDRFHVVIAGGGVAALETLLALRALAGHLIDVTLISPTSEFVYRPVTVAEAFDRARAQVYDLAEILADQSRGKLIHDTLADVETASRIVVTGTGRRISSTRGGGHGSRARRTVSGRIHVPRPGRRPGSARPAPRPHRGPGKIGGARAPVGANVALAPVRARADDRRPPSTVPVTSG